MRASTARIHYYKTPFSERYLQTRPKTSTGNIVKDLAEYPRKYENVVVFNLRKGCDVRKNSSSLNVTLNTDKFFEKDIPHMPKKKLSLKKMEEMIKNLMEQVHYLSTYLEEERIKHKTTKKRSAADLENCRKVLEDKHVMAMDRLRDSQYEKICDLREEHNLQIKEIEDENERKYDKLYEEYRQLEASFSIYKEKIVSELNEKFKQKEMEFEWEKQRVREKAGDEAKHELERKFAKEKEELKQEYKNMMKQMVKDQRSEMEQFIRKSTDGYSIEELREKARRTDALETMLAEGNDRVKILTQDLKRAVHNLNESKSQLTIFQQKFDDKVAAVEDKYRNRINDLTQEVSDLRVKWIGRSQDLFKERLEIDKLQSERTKYAKEKLMKVITEKTNEQHEISLSILNSKKPEKGTHEGDKELAVLDKTHLECEVDNLKLNKTELERNITNILPLPGNETLTKDDDSELAVHLRPSKISLEIKTNLLMKNIERLSRPSSPTVIY